MCLKLPKMCKSLMVQAFLFLSGSISWAQMTAVVHEQEELIQEFIVAETAVIQQEGEVQLCFGSRFFDQEGILSWQTPFVIEWSITDLLQIGAATSYFSGKQSVIGE